MNEIEQALIRLFDRHRIVVWTDTKRELEAEYNALWLAGVEKIAIANNEFGVKVRILRRESGKKFLLYRAGPPPDDADNWLLDVELAHGVFRADQAALWGQQAGLGPEFMDLVAEHPEFFRAGTRREALRRLLRPDDGPGDIRLKMLAVCAETPATADTAPRPDDILKRLLGDLAAGRDEREQLIRRSGLDAWLWRLAGRAFGYASGTPGVEDFAIILFSSAYRLGLGEGAPLNASVTAFMGEWMDSVTHHGAFETLSARYAAVLGIEADLHKRELHALADLDLFEMIDWKVLSDLALAVSGRTMTTEFAADLIRRRRLGHWFARHEDSYEAIDCGAQLLSAIDSVDLTMTSPAAAVRRYKDAWYELDQLYRRFIYHMRRSGQMSLLGKLYEEVENRYNNHYLLRLNDRWQELVDATGRWEAAPVLGQGEFFERRVKPFNKVAVIISDALRYEAGEELVRRIRREDRYEAEIEPALAMLPSFTQLGMAALLPHGDLTFAPDGKSILVDGLSSQGTENRRKLLSAATAGTATAIGAEELLALDRDGGRALIRAHDMVYIYHNRIDAVGDKRDTEERVFEAVEEALVELVQIIKKLTAANVNNMLVTADHGFIYQHRPLEESDFLSEAADRAGALAYNRRFVVGRGLPSSPGFKRFTAAQVGLGGDVDILIPKSINRLRVQGAGSRYVHGGAALQEVVIPIIKINKKRVTDVAKVEVDILQGANRVITTGQLPVNFYQLTPVTDKVQPRVLRAGIYTRDGALISNSHTLVFDLTAEDTRRRELSARFILTGAAEAANNQDVVLRLDERVGDTSHYREYKSALYTLRRSFTSDFDF